MIPMLLVRERTFFNRDLTVLWDHLLQDKHYFHINIQRHTSKVGRYIHIQ